MDTPHRFSKHFSRDEAQKWIPRLQELLPELVEALDQVEPDMVLIHAKVQRRGNGGGIDTPHYFAHDTVIDGHLDEIQAAGIVIQDLRRGLVDFPHLLDDREVFLCWQLDDGDTLGWYHEIADGFKGRRPLP